MRFFAGRPVAVSMALLATIIAGARAAATLPLSRLPEIAVPRIVVEAAMPGLPAEELRSLVAAPLEDALSTAKGLSSSSSVCRDGRVAIALDFGWGEDPSRAASRVREILDAAYTSLPEGASKPIVLPYDPLATPLLVAAVSPREGDLSLARRLAEYEVKGRLRRVAGAGCVTLVGGSRREAAVAVDSRLAAARGMTVVDVARAIGSECVDVPVGSLREGDLELVAVARGRASSVRELSGILASAPSGSFRVSDIAKVVERDARRDSVFVADGEEAVAVELYRNPGADPVATARRARAALEELSAVLGDDVGLSVVWDSSIPVAASIRDLAVAASLGAAAAAFALLAVLGDLRLGLLVASSIPISVAATLASLSALGRSLNVMSLGGMGLAVGMISDNAVVMLDALASRLSAGSERPRPDAVAAAAGTAISGTFGSMATTAVVFVPVLFLPGAVGELFGDLAVAVIASNAFGWLCAVLALPAVYRVAWRRAEARPKRALEAGYRRALRFALRRPTLTLAAASIAAASGTALVLTRDASFMPKDAATELSVIADFQPGTDPGAMAGEAKRLSAALSALPFVSSAFGGAGSETDDYARRASLDYSIERLSLTCALRRGANAETVMPALLEAAKAATRGTAAITVSVPADPAASLLGLDRGTLLAVKGESTRDARERAGLLAAAIAEEAGEALSGVSFAPSGMKPRIVMTPDREACSVLGITLSEAALALRTATEGAVAARIELCGRDTDVRVFAEGMGGADVSALGASAVPVSVQAGIPIRASAIARFAMTLEPSSAARLDRADVVYLEAKPAPGRIKALEAAIDRALIEDPSASRSDGSAFRTYGDAMRSAVLLVLALLYLTLGAQFESLTLPFVIMATIPLSMAGAGPVMVLAGVGLDSGSVIGLVALFGLVVNNAILLYEAGATRRLAGLSTVAAAYGGASERLRPVLATTVTTVVALLPVCLFSSGAVQRSMSAAMLGGVVASTALTLFVSPIAFAAGIGSGKRA